ncbi:MAG: glycoside hydrolase family 2 TIM barrel-domain containing protein [Bacteroidota bacterium]
MKTYIKVLVVILLASNCVLAQRINSTINSAWKFQKGDINSAVDEINAQEWETINLPHTWNSEDAFDEEDGYYRGIGWYVKQLAVPAEWEGKTVFIKFEGANQTSELFLNGKPIGNHIGGYTAFSFDLSTVLKYGETNVLAVKVDNSHDENIPPLTADYTFYGGIYRNVRLIVADPIHFDLSNNGSDGVFVSTPKVSDQNASITIQGSVQNSSAQKKKVIVETSILDKNNQVIGTKSSKVTINPNSKSDFTHEGIQVNSPNLWSPDSPYLYQAITTVKEDTRNAQVTDRIDIPVGLRWFEFNNNGSFMLNGKPLKLIGSNRHQDFKGHGNALTDDYHFNDYKQIKEMGFNFVRLAHYPQAPEVYRACDELGLLVWSEIPVVSRITDSEQFAQNSLNMQREHIRQTRNHPSLIIYGYMNEVFLLFQYSRNMSDEDRQKTANAIVELAKKLEALTKDEAPAHSTVMAMHRHTSYNEYGLTEIPDVVGWNLYFGWYYDKMEDLTTFLADQRQKYPNQKMIVSEYGPGTDARIHARNPSVQDFSEEFQFKMHASYLKQMMEMSDLAGFAAWNFADFGSSGRADAIPHINQKGLVNFDRTEKDVCGLYRAYFLDDPVTYIASRNYITRAGVEQSENAGVSMDSVKIFSNQSTIELKLNGKSLGKSPVKDYEVNFAVPFENGKNVLTAVGENGSDQLTIDYTIIPTNLNSGVDDLAINVGSNVSFYDSGTKVLWIPDQAYEENSWGYVGGAPYTVQRRQLTTGISQDIDGTDCNPLFQTFVEGLSGYQFDVPEGNYKVTLNFTEYITRRQQEELVFNLNNRNTSREVAEPREFDVLINGKNVIDELNIEEDYGSLRAVSFDFDVKVQNKEGIKVGFASESGKTILSGIRIRKI